MKKSQSIVMSPVHEDTVVVADKRAQMVHAWKIAMCHGDLGQAAVIRKALEKDKPAPVAPAEEVAPEKPEDPK